MLYLSRVYEVLWNLENENPSLHYINVFKIVSISEPPWPNDCSKPGWQEKQGGNVENVF